MAFPVFFLGGPESAGGDSIEAMPFGRRRIRELDETAISGAVEVSNGYMIIYYMVIFLWGLDMNYIRYD